MLQEAVRSHQSSLGVGRLQSCQFEAILIQELREQTFGQGRGDTTGLGQPCRYDTSCTRTWTPSMRPWSSSTIRACAESRWPWVEARRGRGVVAAASYEARQYGVRSAMPMRTALQRCPDLIRVDARFGRYAEVSRRVMEIFRDITPLVEPLSMDEAYMDVTESVTPERSPEDIARALKQRVKREVGLTISVGVRREQVGGQDRLRSRQARRPDGRTAGDRGRVPRSAARGNAAGRGSQDSGAPEGRRRD